MCFGFPRFVLFSRFNIPTNCDTANTISHKTHLNCWQLWYPKCFWIFPVRPHLNGVHWQDLNPEVDKPGKRKKLDATARAGSEDKDAGINQIASSLWCLYFFFLKEAWHEQEVRTTKMLASSSLCPTKSNLTDVKMWRMRFENGNK